jgi:hypothetical protein
VRALLAVAVAAAAGAAVAAPQFRQVDVSRAPGPQAEAAVAADPSNPETLLAGSVSLEPGHVMRVYGSTDGGATWTSAPLRPPGKPGQRCAVGDPVPAIASDGRQYFAYIAENCDDLLLHDDELKNVEVVLASRPDATARWTQRLTVPHPEPRNDDKPALALDDSPPSPHFGRLYLTFTRVGEESGRVLASYSDNRGHTWSRPVPVSDRRGRFETFSSVAVGADGTVYAVWTDETRTVYLDRSRNGARFGADRVVDRGAPAPRGQCGFQGASTAIPAQKYRCVTMTPFVTTDLSGGLRTGTVYVTYVAAGGPGSEQDVFAAAFDAALRPLAGAPAGARTVVGGADPPGYLADQFLAASTVDRSTGDLWACFYDTTGDRSRVRAWYSCSVSSDGGATWAPRLRVASVPSNATIPRADDFQFGDYEGVAAAAGVAHPMWADTRALGSRLREEVFTAAVPRNVLR